MCRTPAQRKDAHAVATAVRAKASTIVTHNINDFAPAVIQHYGLTKILPDAFCVDLLADRPRKVLAGLRQHRRSLWRTPMDPAQ
jgi:hypothetical protein